MCAEQLTWLQDIPHTAHTHMQMLGLSGAGAAVCTRLTALCVRCVIFLQTLLHLSRLSFFFLCCAGPAVPCTCCALSQTCLRPMQPSCSSTSKFSQPGPCWSSCCPRVWLQQQSTGSQRGATPWWMCLCPHTMSLHRRDCDTQHTLSTQQDTAQHAAAINKPNGPTARGSSMCLCRL